MADKVSAKIKADAKARVTEIEADFAERRAKLEADKKKQAASFRSRTKELAEQEAERIRREILSDARLSARREILTARHELIQKAIDEAARKFTQSRGYSTLIGRLVREFGKGARVCIAAADKKRFKASTWGKNALVVPISGGVILRTVAYDVNFSLDAAFDALGEELSLDLAGILFGESKAGKSGTRTRAKKRNKQVS